MSVIFTMPLSSYRFKGTLTLAIFYIIAIITCVCTSKHDNAIGYSVGLLVRPANNLLFTPLPPLPSPLSLACTLTHFRIFRKCDDACVRMRTQAACGVITVILAVLPRAERGYVEVEQVEDTIFVGRWFLAIFMSLSFGLGLGVVTGGHWTMYIRASDPTRKF